MFADVPLVKGLYYQVLEAFGVAVYLICIVSIDIFKLIDSLLSHVQAAAGPIKGILHFYYGAFGF